MCSMTRYGVLFCVVLCLPALAAGQDSAIPAKLTLADALRLAAERNPSFAAAKNAVEAAEADRAIAGRRPNPALSVDSAGYSPGAENTAGGGFLDKQELTVRFDQELELGGRRRFRVEAADAGIEVARLQARDRLRRLEFDVRRAYFEAVLARSNRDVANAALAEIDRVIALNRARFDQGEISGGDLRRLQVERLRFVDDTFQSELEYRNAIGTLLAMLNASSLSLTIEVTEPLTRPAVQGAVLASVTGPKSAPVSLLPDALTARPDVLAARRAVQRADTETRLQRALRAPSPTIGGGYRRDFGAGGLVFGVTIPLPLFNSLNAGGVTRAEAERRRAQNEATAVENTVRLDVQLAANAVEVNSARVSYIEREYLKAAQESRDIVLASYRIGETDLIDFLDSQRAFRETLRTYNRALFDARLSEFALDAAVGASTNTQ